MELIKLSSKLKSHQDEIADEIIYLFRDDADYLHTLKELERKIAICLANDRGSILIKVRNGKLIF